MSDATPKFGGGLETLTAREQEIMVSAMCCLKGGPPDIDFEKLAGKVGMSNPRSAANAWIVIKKKMGWNLLSATSSPASGKRKAAATKKAAKPTADDGDDNNNDSGAEEAATPTAAPRKRAKVGASDGKPAARKKGASGSGGAKGKGKVKAEAEAETVKEEEDDEGGAGLVKEDAERASDESEGI